MPKYEVRNMGDDEENQDNHELVGSKDLRESFKDKPRIRGSFSINGVEFTNFEANSPANAVEQINAKSGLTGVKASVDDKGHLVLESNSPNEPAVTDGAAYVEPPKSYPSDEARQADLQAQSEARMAREAKGEKDPAAENSILDDLGLTATEQDKDGNEVARPGFETGASAEDRKKAREEARKNAGANLGAAGGTAGAGQTQSPTQVPSAPVTGGQVDGKLDDGRGRTGTGAGLQAYPDGTRPVAGSPAREGSDLQGGNVADNQAGQGNTPQP